MPESPDARLSSGWLRVLDWSERLLILGLFGALVARFLANLQVDFQFANLIWLVSESLVIVLFVIRRSATSISFRFSDWLIALGATIAPLFFHAVPNKSLLPNAPGALWILIGFLIQVHAKLCLGRSMGCVPANRGVKGGGPYQFVRHPMYLGYCIADSGLVLMNPDLRNLTCLALAWLLMVPRILAEERFLAADPDYAAYMRRVRYRLIPGIF